MPMKNDVPLLRSTPSLHPYLHPFITLTGPYPHHHYTFPSPASPFLPPSLNISFIFFSLPFPTLPITSFHLSLVPTPPPIQPLKTSSFTATPLLTLLFRRLPSHSPKSSMSSCLPLSLFLPRPLLTYTAAIFCLPAIYPRRRASARGAALSRDVIYLLDGGTFSL